MRILALNPFHSGSHAAFFDGWREHSRHDWTCLTLPGRHWKWRMRHAAITFGERIKNEFTTGVFDIIVTTDMLNVAELRGVTTQSIGPVPIVCYFHENQLTYPDRKQQDRDHHFAFTNIASAITAEEIWFNSRYHLDDFFTAAEQFLRRMPDCAPIPQLQAARERASVQYPGIQWPAEGNQEPTSKTPLHICWAARWEHDKNPQDFFDTLRALKQLDVPFQLSVLGQQFETTPRCFSVAKKEFANEIQRWGYQPSQADYYQALQAADCFVSTAQHEFFGIAAAEAMSCGCIPLLPRRLAYPELLAKAENFAINALYDGSVNALTSALVDLAAIKRESPEAITTMRYHARQATRQYDWQIRAKEVDAALEMVAT